MRLLFRLIGIAFCAGFALLRDQSFPPASVIPY